MAALDIATNVKHLCPGSRYFSKGIEGDVGEYEDVPVVIHDAQPRRTKCNLDTSGFTLVDHHSEVLP